MAKFRLMVSDIKAGGGTTIDLYFNGKMIKEVKTFDDGAKTETLISQEDFDAELYGEAGQRFLDSIIL
jgi:hypothetical protein